MKLFLIILLSITLFTNMRCTKNEEQQTHCDSSNTAYIPSDARSRFSFKEGTYWVYKNMENNDLDTIIVKDWYHTIAPPLRNKYGDGYKNKCYERTIFSIVSKKYGWFNVYIDFNNAFNQLDSTIEQYFITESSQDVDNFVSYRWRFRGGILIDSLSSGKIERIYSMELNNKIYSDIIHYSFRPGFESSDYIKDGWYANRIGLIKMVRMDGTAWELINSKITQ